MRLELRIACLPQREGELVREARLVLPPGRVDDAVGGVVVHAQQHRFATGGRGLQTGGELGRYPRRDARIVGTCLYQHGGIFHAIFDCEVPRLR